MHLRTQTRVTAGYEIECHVSFPTTLDEIAATYPNSCSHQVPFC